jgi:hypothetical protein
MIPHFYQRFSLSYSEKTSLQHFFSILIPLESKKSTSFGIKQSSKESQYPRQRGFTKNSLRISSNQEDVFENYCYLNMYYDFRSGTG